MVNKVKNLAFIVLISLSANVFAEVSIHADKTVASILDTIELTVTISGNSSSSPDLSIIEENFEITSSGTQSYSSFSYGFGSNQNSSSKTILSYTLKPKRAGVFTIPAIQSGKSYSKPFQIKILPPEEAAKRKVEEYFIEDSIETNTTYLGASIIYSYKYYFSKNARIGDLRGPSFSPQNGIKLHLLENEKKYRQNVNGQLYEVIEYKYIITPEKTGNYKIEPPMVIALERSSSGRLKTVYKKGNEYSLEVKPRPKAFNNKWWLPASSLKLSDKFDPDIKEYKLGEPINREIIIEATGVFSKQLPDITINSAEGVKVYPDKPTRKTSRNSSTIISKMSQKVLYIPNQSGEITLPEVSVTWWNTKSEKLEISTIPEKTIFIKGNIGQQKNQAIAQENTIIPNENNINEEKNQDAANIEPVNSLPTESKSKYSLDNNKWFWPFITILVLFIITTIVLLVIIFILAKKKNANPNPKSEKQKINIEGNISYEKLCSSLKSACRQNDSVQAQKILAQIIDYCFGAFNKNTFEDILQIVSDEKLSVQTNILLENTYGKSNTKWDGNQFWNALEPNLEKIRNIKKRDTKEFNIIKPL